LGKKIYCSIARPEELELGYELALSESDNELDELDASSLVKNIPLESLFGIFQH